MKRSSTSLRKAAKTFSVIVCAISCAWSLRAAPLPPSSVVSSLAPEAEPVGGSVIDTLTVPYENSPMPGTLMSGTLISQVGGLTFTYQILANTTSSPIDMLDLTGFQELQVNASWAEKDMGSGFTHVYRGPGGYEVLYYFNEGDSIQPGHASGLLVLQTDAQDYNHSVVLVGPYGLSSHPSGDGPTYVESFVPVTVVPEPATVTLAVFGLAAVALLRVVGTNRTVARLPDARLLLIAQIRL
jgi:hypothetical protein